MREISGVLQATDHLRPDELIEVARRLESLGYPQLWLPDFVGRELFVLAGHILANTERIGVATGIATIYTRDALAHAQAAQTLNELYDGRFMLGLGVSHPPLAEMRGHRWEPPVEKMSAYLQAIRAGRETLRGAPDTSPIVIAAHGPKMLAVAGDHADGANTYLMPPEHTAEARAIVGTDTMLTVTLPCCLETDPAMARGFARRALGMYMPLPAYHRGWRRWGLDGEWADGGSDRLIDTLVAWGDADTIRARMQAHLDAGADHLAVIPYNPHGTELAWDLLEAIAPGS